MAERSLESIASDLAQKTCEFVAGHSDNVEAIKKELVDLKHTLVRDAASYRTTDSLSSIKDEPELLYALAQALPAPDLKNLFQTRTSFLSLAVAVFIGWILGGLLSGVLSFFSLGGDILRAATIFLTVWGSEYLTANPRARRIFLTCLGMGGLIRFAGMAAGGLVRLANPLSWRALIFPGKMPFFKGIWLMTGAFFIVVFFSKKSSGIDIPVFRETLESLILEDMRLIVFVLNQIDARDAKIRILKEDNESARKDALLKKQRDVIASLIEVRDSLNEDQRTYLNQKLSQAGIESSEDDYIIWNSREHEALYDTVGLINDGDKARVLRPVENWHGNIVKGCAQRAY